MMIRIEIDAVGVHVAVVAVEIDVDVAVEDVMLLIADQDPGHTPSITLLVHVIIINRNQERDLVRQFRDRHQEIRFHVIGKLIEF